MFIAESVSEKNKIGEYLAKLQSKTWLSRALSTSFSIVLAGAYSAWDNHSLARNFAKCSPIKKITHKLCNKPFLIWLLTTPPHLKYAATLPCNLSLTVCFADINVSQGSVATHARCGKIFNIHLT